jgi:hypothetical protein
MLSKLSKTKKIAAIAVVAIVLVGIIYLVINSQSKATSPVETKLSGVAKQFTYQGSTARIQVTKVTMDAANIKDGLPADSGKQYVKMTVSISHGPDGAFTPIDFRLSNVNDASNSVPVSARLNLSREFDMKSSAGSGDLGFMVDKTWKKEDLQLLIQPDTKQKEIVRLSLSDATQLSAANATTSLTGKTGQLKSYIDGSLDVTVNKVIRNVQNSKVTVSDGDELVGVEITLTNSGTNTVSMSYPTIKILTKRFDLDPISKEFQSDKYSDALPESYSFKSGDKLTKTVYFLIPAGDSNLTLVLGSGANQQKIALY